MTGQFDGDYQDNRDDLERELAAALRAEAERTTPAGDGLARIRARTAGRAGAFAWLFRPATAGAVLALTLVAATVIGMNLADDATDTVIADPPNIPIAVAPNAAPTSIADDPTHAPKINPTPGPPVGYEGGELPTPDTAVTDPPSTLAATSPVTPEQERTRNDGGIPVDTGGTYVSITAPLSGTTIEPVFTLAGQARVFEAAVSIDISQNGTVLKQAHATATEAGPALGDWQATITLAPGNYRIDAYALSPEDGIKRLAGDSIWITVKAPATARPSATPSATATATPTGTSTPAPSTPATEPQY